MRRISCLLVFLVVAAMVVSGAGSIPQSADGSGGFPANPPSFLLDLTNARLAVERVYWNHRIWPSANSGSKPSFDTVVSEDQIRLRVEDDLRRSRALELWWGHRVSDGEVQAELNRMTAESKDPQMLAEIFTALGNDPRLIGEILVRPMIVDRFLHNWFARDERFHGPLQAAAEQELAQLRNGEGTAGTVLFHEATWTRAAATSTEPSTVTHTVSDTEWRSILADLSYQLAQEPAASSLDTGALDEAAALLERIPLETWGRLNESNETFYSVSVVAKSADQLRVRAAVWQKLSFADWWAGERERTPPDTSRAGTNIAMPAITAAPCVPETWKATARSDAPDPRNSHVAVWTGTEMIVWDGNAGLAPIQTRGARYSPVTDTWASMNIGENLEIPWSGTEAVWTGREMIVWGGAAGKGGLYDPQTDSWRSTSMVSSPSPRFGHTAVWTGTEMIVFGGRTVAGQALKDGHRYDPSNDRWRPTQTTSNLPRARWEHTAVWTGTEMIVWGGVGTTSAGFTGERYDPAADTWRALPPDGPTPTFRTRHTAIWTGREMITWGGSSGGDDAVREGRRYDPVTNSWAPLSTFNQPVPRYFHTAVWTGREMIVWGGLPDLSGTNSYGRYDPATNSWLPVSTVNQPTSRAGHTAVWTGTEMIVWGGSLGIGTPTYFGTGGRYDPTTDSWLPTSTGESMPGVRWSHTAVWTGAEMVVWGGQGLVQGFAVLHRSGGRYDLATDTWRSTSTGTNCPQATSSHTAVWSGTEMIVWGGGGGGGRYDVVTDTWKRIASGPESRPYHTAVWTGREMIIWGGLGARNDGSRYDPVLDRWTPTFRLDGFPEGRENHTAVWTGDRMIVWGGFGTGRTTRNTGAVYDPGTNEWRTTRVDEFTPSPRVRHTATWTGRRMIVWGGDDNGPSFGDGALYDPVADSWQSVAAAGAPSARLFHTAIWDGDEMLVWGGFEGGDGVDTGAKYDADDDVWSPIPVGLGSPDGRAQHTAVWTGAEMTVWGGTCVPRVPSGGRYCPCDQTPWYFDGDGDGFGDAHVPRTACSQPQGFVVDAGDCDDTTREVFPGAHEVCDGRDNDCDGAIDDADATSCGDGTLCTGDRCEAGACVHEPVTCEDGNACTNDSCDATAGCSFDASGTCDHAPKGQGYWKRICDKPHTSGEFLTPMDVVCVGQSLTFSDLRNAEEICGGLEADPPSDKCLQAEAQFLALQLNVCRQRVTAADPIRSACSASGTVGESVEEIDAILSSSSRDRDSCVRAQCLADEINSGTAIETDSLRLSKLGSGIRLSWDAPYTPDRGEPRLYRVARRRPGEVVFVPLAETAERFLDLVEDGADAEYDIGFVW